MTTIKEAIKKWEVANKRPISEEVEVGFQFQNPPIEKMDATLSQLVKCERLYLSSNLIDKISGLSGMKHLKVLSVARCKLLTLSGVEAVSETLEELWASYNMIIKLNPLVPCKQLKILYLNYNYIRDWNEVARLSDHPYLKDVSFIENPIGRNMDEDTWRQRMLKTLPKINRLDGEFLSSGDDAKEDEFTKEVNLPKLPAASPPPAAASPPPAVTSPPPAAASLPPSSPPPS